MEEEEEEEEEEAEEEEEQAEPLFVVHPEKRKRGTCTGYEKSDPSSCE